jgi:hypothetical protein
MSHKLFNDEDAKQLAIRYCTQDIKQRELCEEYHTYSSLISTTIRRGVIALCRKNGLKGGDRYAAVEAKALKHGMDPMDLWCVWCYVLDRHLEYTF